MNIFRRQRIPTDAATLAEALWREHGAMLTRTLPSYEADPHLLEDLAQNLFIAIQASVVHVSAATHPKAYLMRIAHNVATDHIARELRKPLTTDSGETLDQEDPLQNPALIVEAESQQNSLLQAVRNLPLSIRQVMVLLLEGVEQEEIGEVLGISHGNVRVRINRGKQLLKEMMTHDRP